LIPAGRPQLMKKLLTRPGSGITDLLFDSKSMNFSWSILQYYGFGLEIRYEEYPSQSLHISKELGDFHI
jgi:hypothetical protein